MSKPIRDFTKIDRDEKIISIATQVNVDLWATPHEKHPLLIEKFGSKENAMAETFFLLVRGLRIAVDKLPQLVEKEQWTVQTWYQYKLGNAPFEHAEKHDEKFDSEWEANEYARKADSGVGGDTRYRYEVIPPK